MIKKFSEFKINESSPNYDFQSKVENTDAWNQLQRELEFQ